MQLEIGLVAKQVLLDAPPVEADRLPRQSEPRKVGRFQQRSWYMKVNDIMNPFVGGLAMLNNNM